MNPATQIDILALALSTLDTLTRKEVFQKAAKRKADSITMSNFDINQEESKLNSEDPPSQVSIGIILQ